MDPQRRAVLLRASRMDLSVLIPAFNERSRIVGTIDGLRSFLASRPWEHEIIVVDDGSDDGTAEVVAEAALGRPEVRCLRSDRNRGKGAAVRLGLEAARGRVVGFIDADDKTDAAALDEVFRVLSSGADIAIGDRTLPGSDIRTPRRPYREWGSAQFRRLTRWWLGLGEFPDTQCGFKFFRAPVMRGLFEAARVDGYMFDVEVLLLATRAGYSIARVPVRWRDDPDSRFRLLSGSLRNLRELRRIRRMHR